MRRSELLACVEVGGSSTQTVVFGDDTAVMLDGAHQPRGAMLALAVPGLVESGRVIVASNLDWTNVDPVDALELPGPALVVCNDAEAAAVGEGALRDAVEGLVYVGLGTGIGGAVVGADGVVGANLFGHDRSFGRRRCRCGGHGCLETVAAGWALPPELDAARLEAVATAVAGAIEREPAVGGIDLVVLGGGMCRAYPALVDLVDHALPTRRVEPTAAPPTAKSAAAWGLRQLVLDLDRVHRS